jgi:hypothetical protein
MGMDQLTEVVQELGQEQPSVRHIHKRQEDAHVRSNVQDVLLEEEDIHIHNLAAALARDTQHSPAEVGIHIQEDSYVADIHLANAGCDSYIIYFLV